MVSMRVLVVTAVVVAGACSGHGSGVNDAGDGAAKDGTSADATDAAIDADEGTGFRIGGTALGARAPARIYVQTTQGRRELWITEDGAFRFAGKFPDATAFTVSTDDGGCSVVNGTGTISGANVTSVEVYCIGVVELASVSFTPSILTISPAFDPRHMMYAGTRPLFMDTADLMAATPVASYPTLATIDVSGQPTTSGVMSSPTPIGSAVVITLSHSTGLVRTYGFFSSPLPRFEAYVKASDPAQGAQFGGGASSTCGSAFNGNGVALSGDTLVVGAPCANAGAGAVYVYRRTNITWAFEAKLQAPAPLTGDQFGASVAIDGNTVVVGAPYQGGAGAAFVFTRAVTTWSQQAVLGASNPDAGDRFGLSVAVAGDSVVVGAPREDSDADTVNGTQTNNAATDAGAAYVLVRSGTTWSQQAYLKAPASDGGDSFGFAVSISADTIVVGAPTEDGASNAAIDSGAGFAFARSGTTWTQQATLRASNAGSGDLFGWAVSVDGAFAAIGAPSEDSAGVESDNSKSSAGAAYVYERAGTSWTQRAYLKSPSPDINDEFGDSVAIDRAHVVVGAPGEAGSTLQIDGAVDNAAAAAGAAFAFRRQTTTWSQLHYIKAPNTDAADRLGRSVAVDGDTFVVGASGEASNATNVGGNQADDSLLQAGAVYVYR
jgi:hypothetical protein